MLCVLVSYLKKYIYLFNEVNPVCQDQTVTKLKVPSRTLPEIAVHFLTLAVGQSLEGSPVPFILLEICKALKQVWNEFVTSNLYKAYKFFRGVQSPLEPFSYKQKLQPSKLALSSKLCSVTFRVPPYLPLLFITACHTLSNRVKPGQWSPLFI